MNDVTNILQRIEAGDPSGSRDLLPLVYDELRRLASRELSHESPGMTLQPTALVHEAYLRLVDQKDEPQWNHRGHFYAAAAESMRRILVDDARRRGALKRGGQFRQVPLDENQVAAPQSHPDLVALDEALSQLGQVRPDLAKLISLRYFAGLTLSQAAASLDVSLRTAERNWTYARTWLRQFLSETDSKD